MTNVSAGFLYDQLNDIDHILTLKNNIFKNYNRLINENITSFKNKIVDIHNEPGTICSKWIYCIILKDLCYNNFEKFMFENGISIRPLFYDLRSHTHLDGLIYKYDKNTIFNHGFMIPSYPELTYEHQSYIIHTIIKYIHIYE
jgi:dTDP-4-amino-4,6-dideoxygalactose transaminase